MFPQRQSNADFLAWYQTLKEDNEANGIDLQENGEEDEPDDDFRDVAGLIDKKRLDNDEKSHKALDASRRADDERAMEALARRFEERAQSYLEDDASDPHGGDALLREMQHAARKAARKERAALRREEAEKAACEQAAEAEKRAKTTAAMVALYDLYATDTTEVVASTVEQTALASAAVEKRTVEDAIGSSLPVTGKYRIKKKLKSA